MNRASLLVPRPLWLAMTLLLGALALDACGERRASGGSGASGPSATGATSAPIASPAPPAEVLPEARAVRLITSDGFHVAGTLQPAATADAPAVILVHQLGGDRTEWAALLERLHAEPALTTLAIDLRGHGESTEGPPGAGVVVYGALDAAGWAATANDVRAAIAFLTSAESGVRPAHIAAVGSSIGASAVIAAAALEPRIEHIVALSPGRAYHGFDAITPAIGLGDRTFLGVVAREETDNVETATALGRVMHGEPVLVDGAAHGVALFSADPTTLDRVEGFLREALRAPRRDAPPSTASRTTPGSVSEAEAAAAATPAAPRGAAEGPSAEAAAASGGEHGTVAR